MPRARQAKTSPEAAIKVEPPVSKKRRRGEANLPEAEISPVDKASSKPPASKRTKTAEDLPNGTASPSLSSSRRRGKAVNVQVEEEVKVTVSTAPNGSLKIEEEDDLEITTTKKSEGRKGNAKRKAKSEALEDEEAGDGELSAAAGEEQATPKKKRNRKPKAEKEPQQGDAETIPAEDLPIKPKRKRKTQEEKDLEAMPLAFRTANLQMFVGAHTSIAKGVENAITNCVHVGGNAFACFLKSQRKWENPSLKDENRDAFRKALVEHKYDGMNHIVPHGSYLVNLATEDKDKAKQSYDAFIDDLHRCEALGIRYYNFHPGGAGQSTFDSAITRLANNLNRALSETTTVVPLLENMAGHGTLIGGRFSDLRDVISQIKPEFQSRIGVCIDTCHAFAAGYDLRSPGSFAKTMQDFDSTVGLKYIKALHLNDSKAPLHSHRDLHQNIGLGFLGLRAFHNVMNYEPFRGLPLILETPCERPDPSDPKGKKTIDDKTIWAGEIKLLESLIGMDPESETFKALEKDLAEKGAKERDEMQRKFEDKQEKVRKKAAKEREKGQKSLAEMFGGKAKGQDAKTKGTKKNKKTSDEDSGSESGSSALSSLSESES